MPSLLFVDRLNIAAASLHAAQAIAVIALTAWLENRGAAGAAGAAGAPFADGKIPIYRTVGYGHAPADNSVATLPAGHIDIRGLIIAFFALSALCQGAASALGAALAVRARMRFAEYSVSASVMLLGIATEAGVRDAHTLAALFVLCAATMLLGAIAEDAQGRDAPWAWVLPHAAGWLTFVAAYAPVLDAFLINAAHADRTPPQFVTVIVFLQGALFGCFGVVQTVALTRRALAFATADADTSFTYGNYYSQNYTPGPRSDAAITAEIDAQSECAYITLSLTAKTLLAWIVLSPIIAGAR